MTLYRMGAACDSAISSSAQHAGACTMAQIDHLILQVNDREKSIEFFTRILGFTHEGDRDPFAMIRVAPGFMLQLAPWGTEGNAHLAFQMSRAEFDAAFDRIRYVGS